MRGVAKVFNTEQDVLNCLAVDAVSTKEQLREMLAGRFTWFQTEKLADGVSGLEDETHKVVVMPDMDNDTEERWQYELREDENAWMFRIGLSVEKITTMLEE